MKAILRNSDTPGDFRLAEIPEPRTVPGRVKIKVAYAGICGSDLHIYLGKEPGLPQGVHGHEFSGTVVELGRGVTGVQVGDRVTVEHTDSTCGRCIYCKTGRYQLCPRRESLGFTTQGAFAEYIVVDPQYIHPLPEGVSLEAGALTEPLACVVHGVELVGVTPGKRVLVVGPGPMGILMGLVLMAYGATVDLVGAQEDAERLAFGRRLGMNTSAWPGEYDLVAECSGSNGGVKSAIDALNKGGTLLQMGIAVEPLTLPYEQAVYKELRIQGTFCHTYKDWELALRLEQAKLLNAAPVITDIVEPEAWKQAFERLLARQGLKTLIRFS